MQPNRYVITEYQGFVSKKEYASSGFHYLKREQYNALEDFVLSQRTKDADAVELMSISAKKGGCKVITAKGYVGLISLKDGTQIEILPKIGRDDTVSEEQAKRVFLKMLRSFMAFNYKTVQMANINIEKLSIFEIFIRMFVDEVLRLVKCGIKRDYLPVSENLPYFKGKLLVSDHIRKNAAHKERAFVEYDTYTENRPENRLIKTTLDLLYHKSTDNRNRKDLRTLLDFFENIPLSDNVQADFLKCKNDRTMVQYINPLIWAKIFLQGKSFATYSGSNLAFALLFPMDALFESYIAAEIKKVLYGKHYSVKAQDHSMYLYEYPSRAFLIKPDVVIADLDTNGKYIIDTKWKLLSAEERNYGISQADMYQMYAYQHKYNADWVTLLYPQTSFVSNHNIEYTSPQGDLVRVRFVDLLNVAQSLKIALSLS